MRAAVGATGVLWARVAPTACPVQGGLAGRSPGSGLDGLAVTSARDLDLVWLGLFGNWNRQPKHPRVHTWPAPGVCPGCLPETVFGLNTPRDRSAFTVSTF